MDSSYSENEEVSQVSQISINSVQTNDSVNASQQHSKHLSTTMDTSADESIIGGRKNKKTQRILDSDSDSESDPDSKPNDSDLERESDDSDEKNDSNDSDEKNESDDSDEEGESSRHNESDEEDASDEKSELDESQSSEIVVHPGAVEDQSKDISYANSSNNDSLLSKHSDSSGAIVVIPATDDEDDQEEEDIDEKEMSQMHCFSPRTRRSITGRRSIKLPVTDSYSDDDIIFSDEEQSVHRSSHLSEYKSAEESTTSNLSKDGKDAETWKRNRSGAANDSAMIRTPNPKRFNGLGANLSTSLMTSTPSRSTPDIEYSDKSDVNTSGIQMQSISHDDSVMVLNSSEEENRQPRANSTAFGFKSFANSSTSGNVKYVQPKLQFDRNALIGKPKYVSRSYYNEQADAMAQIKQELKENEDLFQKLGHTLPDKGANLKRRIAGLQDQLRKKENEFHSYAIDEDHLDDVQVIEPVKQPKVDHKHWRDELEAIQPIHTGKQGLATFNTQKTLTLNRIEKLHRAMDKCPTEMDFAKQPNHLNIELMPHQLHAIKWMRWRENQRPRGGLLADDMGLGKTLTVIGLVLDAKYGKNESLVDENETETDDSDDDVDRGHKHTYKNQGGTLIIAPASLINQWEHEVNNRVKRGKLSVLIHHGNKRVESVHSLCKYDLVITTYGIISSEHKNNGAVFRARWERVVLDEAHMIRNHSTAVSKGCCDLRGTMRWGLTGTPIQNKHMDVYSMLKFLRLTPFDDLPTFKKWINPNSEAGMSRLHNILKPLLLRRTKSELQTKGELQELPNKTMVVEDIELSPEEASIYTKILAYSQTLFAQYMEQHQQRNGAGKFVLGSDVTKRLEQVKRFGRGQEVKSSQILILLLRLRQICDHPGLIHQMLQDECDMEDYEDEECDSMDMNIVKQMIGLKINEGDGENKSDEHDDEDDDDDRKRPKNILSNSDRLYDFKNPSSKCKRAIEIVKRILRETDDKIVVVSQWTSFLNIVADFLHREKVHYVELTGKTPIKERNNIVVSFNNPKSSERVMMLSLVAGGVGLNLTGANNLILLDPHWNPQLESQAFDRVYRVGQKKDGNIYKLLCANTVEKRIQTIQENKLQLSDNVLTGSKQNSGTKLSIHDMRQLFDM